MVTSTLRNIPRFDGTKTENYLEWSSKTRVVLYMSNKDVFDVPNGLVEPSPAITDSDTPDTPTNLAEIQRWNRAYETLFSVLCLVTGGPAATLVQQYGDRTSAGGLGHGQKGRGTLCTPSTTATARKHGGRATRCSENETQYGEPTTGRGTKCPHSD